jgi:hypothetical protein
MIYYANAGFYQFLKNMTSEKENSNLHTVTGTSIVLSRGAKYLVESDLRQRDLYFKFDICQETDYDKIGVNSSGNSNPIMRISTDNDEYPYVNLVLKNRVLHVEREDKSGVLTSIIKVPHMEQYANEPVTYELHISTEGTFDTIQLWINNLSMGKVDNVNYLNNANLMNMEISHGMPSIIAVGQKGYDYKSYVSNIMIGDERLSNKKCMILPTKVVKSDWIKEDGLFVSTEKGQELTLQVDVDKLNKINPLYANTKIDAIMCGSDVAYSEGYNSKIKYDVNGTAFDEKTLANKNYYGVKTKILSKNPSINDYWHIEDLKLAKFTMTSDTRVSED